MSDVTVDGFLADAVTSVDGKLYALGAGWNRIYTASFPARHDRIGIGLLFHITGGSGAHQRRFAVRIETPTGEPLGLGAGPGGAMAAIEGGFTIDDERDVTVPFALQLDGLPLASAGRYTVVVSVDGEDLKTLAFRVESRGETEPSPEPDQRPRPPATGTAGYL